MIAPAAYVLYGIGFQDIASVCGTLKITCINDNTFYNYAKRWIYPSITRNFFKLQHNLIEQLKNGDKPLVLSGDGQYDSPGHCAKHCAYTALAQHWIFSIGFFRWGSRFTYRAMTFQFTSYKQYTRLCKIHQCFTLNHSNQCTDVFIQDLQNCKARPQNG